MRIRIRPSVGFDKLGQEAIVARYPKPPREAMDEPRECHAKRDGYPHGLLPSEPVQPVGEYSQHGYTTERN